MFNSNTKQQQQQNNDNTQEVRIDDLMVECRRVINRMFKKLQNSLLKIEIYVKVYIIHKDYNEVARLISSRYVDTNLRYDYYEMYLHRENAITDVGAYRYIDYDIETEIIDPFYGMGYVDTLELVSEVSNRKENTLLRKCIYYSYPPDDPNYRYILIMPDEVYEYTYYRKFYPNTDDEISDAHRMLGIFRGMTKGSKKYKKILNRLDQKMSFIFRNTTDERIAFEEYFNYRSYIPSYLL